jgi:glycerol uptake facilitator-like aquaporin
LTRSKARLAIAEGAGTAGLVLTVFGGGYLSEKLGATPAESAIIGTLAVVGAFVCILHAIGPLSGGHINPAVTISFLISREISKGDALAYIGAQLLGAAGGALSANLIWGSRMLSSGSSSVSGSGYVAEVLAAGGLIAVIHGTVRGGRADRVPIVVPSFIAAASFAAPFGFANPAVALAKTIAGHGPSYLALIGLIVCESGAAIVAAVGVKWLYAGHAGSQERSNDARDKPMVANLFEIVGSPGSEGTLDAAQQVVQRLIRPTDFVVRHEDGRLLVMIDSGDDDAVRSSLERRANEHLTLAFLAAGRPNASIALRPTNVTQAAS